MEQLTGWESGLVFGDKVDSGWRFLFVGLAMAMCAVFFEFEGVVMMVVVGVWSLESSALASWCADCSAGTTFLMTALLYVCMYIKKRECRFIMF